MLLRIPASILFSANSELLVEHAHNWRGYIAAQDSKLFSFLYQSFVGERPNKFAVFGFIKFFQSDGAEHGTLTEGV